MIPSGIRRTTQILKIPSLASQTGYNFQQFHRFANAECDHTAHTNPRTLPPFNSACPAQEYRLVV
jgi:hypothetical protein